MPTNPTLARSRPAAVAAIAISLAVATSACTATTPSSSPSQLPTATTAAVTAPPSTPTLAPVTPSPSPSTAPTCAQTTLAGLSEAQRVGQLFMVKVAGDVLGADLRVAISDSHVGSVWFGRSYAGVAAIRAQSTAIQDLATKSATGHVGFLIAANQEGGQIQGLSGPGFSTIPSALVQGGWSTNLLESRANLWGTQLLDAGVNTDFAPVADVVTPGTDQQNEPIGQLDREYGHSTGVVTPHVAAFISGMTTAGVGTTAKHFPGLGRVQGNTDTTADVVDDVTTPDDPNLAPFARAIQVGTPYVMVALVTYTKIDPDNLAVFSSTVMGTMLRDHLGFQGVILSDDLGATAVSSVPAGTRAIRFLAAGGDLIVITSLTTTVTMGRAILARAASDDAFRARVDDAALRVLEAKDAAGLLSCS